ncbi:hypothetical protein OPIT5_04720 [Opitutaceae bacterium TAV5]|nr:hypothetical protein OPIT5_04720 [Opitutaceae bacterium TAV5]
MFVCAGILILAVATCWWNSLSAPFIFDDIRAILKNDSIRKLWPLTDVLNPVQESNGVQGRPLVNLSLALNYAAGGDHDTRPYHATNMLFQAGCALLLFGCVRRTLLLPSMREKYGQGSVPLAFSVALLWAIHPLQTESVTCIIQRTELIVSFFFLGMLYCFTRGQDSPHRGFWLALSWCACVLGVASKEVMITAPVVVLLYDRAFVAGSFGEVWRRRRFLYAGYLATWILLTVLMLDNGGRAGAAGFGLGVSWWESLLTQAWAIVRYLRLCFWPHPLVLDYGSFTIRSASAVAGQGILMLALLGSTAWALVKHPKPGFVAASFFVILAPSSSVVPLVTQMVAEHRMHLPLACVVVLVVFGLFETGVRRGLLVPVSLAALLLGTTTVARNRDYLSEETLWRKNIAAFPSSARARTWLGSVLSREKRYEEAALLFRETILQDPRSQTSAYAGLAKCYSELGREEDAMRVLQELISRGMADASAWRVQGDLYRKRGDLPRAVEAFRKAVEMDPKTPALFILYFQALLDAGMWTEAEEICRLLEKHAPDDTRTFLLKGKLSLTRGDNGEALEQLQKALELTERPVREHYEALAQACRALQRHDEAERYERLAETVSPSAEGGPDGQ